MNAILELIQESFAQQHLLAFVFGSIRLTTFAGLAIFLGSQTTLAVRLPIVIALYIPLHPLMVQTIPIDSFNIFNLTNLSVFNTINIFIIIAKEVLLGYLLATFVNFIFYIAMTAGIIADNQRGATSAQESDPFSSEQSSPLGTIFLLSAINLFFVSGGLMAFLAFYYTTYVAWPVFSLLPEIFSYDFAVFGAQQFSFLVNKALILATPFVLATLLCDLSLGIINRFSPQLNVFVLSMPIKSAICSFLIILYLNPFQQEMLNLLQNLQKFIVQMIEIL